MDRNNSRLFDRSSYSDTTISVYNIISSYFVHIYYNTLYQTAVSLKVKGVVPNITLGYRDRIMTFVNVIDSKCKKYYKKENYTGILNNLRKEFETWTNCDTLTMTECINKIVKEVVPEDFYDSIGKDQRRNILSIVLIGALRNFNNHVTNQYMKMIIDNHDDTDNITALTEKFVDCLIEERQKLYTQFINKESKQPEMVDKKYIDMMRGEISKLNSMCKKLENENDQLKQSLNSRVEQLTKVIKQARKNEDRANTLEYELNELKQIKTATQQQLNITRANQEHAEREQRANQERAERERAERERAEREQRAERERAERERAEREQRAERERVEREKNKQKHINEDAEKVNALHIEELLNFDEEKPDKKKIVKKTTKSTAKPEIKRVAKRRNKENVEDSLLNLELDEPNEELDNKPTDKKNVKSNSDIIDDLNDLNESIEY